MGVGKFLEWLIWVVLTADGADDTEKEEASPAVVRTAYLSRLAGVLQASLCVRPASSVQVADVVSVGESRCLYFIKYKRRSQSEKMV